MFELLYSADAPLKTSSLPVISALSTVFEWCMASWLSLYMAGDMGCDETLNTALKSAHFVPGAYLDEILRVTPCLHSPPVLKLSLPEPGISVMPCTEICESPAEDDSCASLIKGSQDSLQADDTVGSTSDDSDADTTFEADADGEDEAEFEYPRSNTYDNQRFEMGQRAPLAPPKLLRDLPQIPTDKLSRKIPPLKRVLSRVFSENGADPGSPASMKSILSKAQHDVTHLFRHDLIPLADSRETLSSGYDNSSAEVSPLPTPTDLARLPAADTTITDTFEYHTHTVTRTVIRPSPGHPFFSHPFRRSSSSPKPAFKSFFRTPELTPVPDARSTFEEELDVSLQRWEDEREGRNAMDIYVIVDREEVIEESWRSLVQEVHYNCRPQSMGLSGECGRW